MKKYSRILSSVLLGVFLLSTARAADTAGSENTTVRIVSEVAAIQAGTPFTVALELTLAAGWHTYWKNPGSSGLATAVDWTLPEGFSAGAIQWPAPHDYEMGGILSFGFGEAHTLLVEITPPAEISSGGSEVELSAAVSWLECMEMCLPGDATVTLTLPVGKEKAKANTAAAPLFEAARAALPVAAEGYGFSVTREGLAVQVAITPPAGLAPGVQNANYYPAHETAVDLEAPRTWEVTEDGYLLSFTAQEDAEGDNIFRGVLIAQHGEWGGALAAQPAIEMDFSTAGAAIPSEPTGTASIGKLRAILYGILGGILLNLMPCVFPVISLKVMGFVNAAHGDRKQAIAHAGVFSFGVISSFWALAILIIGFKMLGNEVGWAFQFQSPYFVIVMALLFTLIALNMFGLFEVGMGLTSVGGKATSGDSWSASFFSGVLATLVATPCTGPFLGTSIGYALSQPGWFIFLFLTSMGVGMSLPYLLLSSSPALMNRVPRPGAWMETFKQFLGFVLLGFALAMVLVLEQQAGSRGLLKLLVGMLILSMGTWVLGRWGAPHRSAKARRIGGGIALLMIVGGIAYSLSYREPLTADALDADRIAELKASGKPLHYQDYTPGAATRLEAEGLPVLWKPWSRDRVAAARKAGRPVFVDFTATWCMICQANKVAMHDGDVEQAFVERDVEVLMADWTGKDEVIRKELMRHGRNGVPLYLLYPADGSAPRVLPQTLPRGLLLDELNKLD